jgi:hypothetical protein
VGDNGTRSVHFQETRNFEASKASKRGNSSISGSRSRIAINATGSIYKRKLCEFSEASIAISLPHEQLREAEENPH